MLDSFITFAQYASFIYREDITKTAKFIKSRMDQLYGLENDNFYIFIQTDQTVTSRYFWVNVDSVYAGLTGINPLYPKWSYLFLRSYGNNKIAEYDFFSKGQKGKGITQNLQNLIKALILKYETTDQCDCTKQLVQNISKGIQQSQTNSWTVICDDKGVTSALIRTFDKKYVNIKAKNCYYTMFLYI